MSVNQTVENVYLRQDAVRLTRKHFWRLLGIVLIFSILPALLEAGLTAVGDALMVSEVTEVIDQYTAMVNSDKLTSSEPMIQAMIDLFSSPKFILYNLFYLVVTGIFSAGLALGVGAQVIATARGDVPSIMGVFGRMRCCFKAWLLQIWTYIKISLWLLPGLFLIIFGAELTMYDLGDLGDLVMVIGVGVMIGLAIPALYRYVMANYIMADEPDRGVRECLTLSKGLMKGRKWQYFKLSVPVWAIIFGVTLLVEGIGTLVVTALGLDTAPAANTVITWVSTLATIYFSIQLYLLDPLFYLKRREPTADAPVSCWLRKEDSPEDTPAPISPDEDEASEAPAESPEDISLETNEKKENDNE